MPFTPTHILAVLPIFAALPLLPIVALAIGAMVPDFVMFFPLSNYAFSHSLAGLFFYILPVGLFFYYVFEWIGRNYALELLPFRVKQSVFVGGPILINIKHVVLSGFAILIGGATHIVWDAFTHQHAWGVQLLPVLNESIQLLGFYLPYYKVFQYGSTFIGLPILAFYLYYTLAERTPSQPDARRLSLRWRLLAYASFIAIPLALMCYYYLVAMPLLIAVGHTIKSSIGIAIVVFFVQACLYKLLFQLNPKNR